MCVSVHICSHIHVCVECRGQFLGISSLVTPHVTQVGFQLARLGSEHLRLLSHHVSSSSTFLYASDKIMKGMGTDSRMNWTLPYFEGEKCEENVYFESYN